MKLHPEVIADHVRETSRRGSALDEKRPRSRAAIATYLIILVAILAAMIYNWF